MPAFSEWESFYVIVGSSGAALTGLQFVVIALTVDLRRRSSTRTLDAFATPTIVHFCATLLIAGVLSAPWRSPLGAVLLLGAIGAGGVVYSVIVAIRARRQTDYSPVFEDWLFHVGLPLLAYGTVAIAATVLHGNHEPALFWIAAATLLLLFIGIHNAWDTVTFLATDTAPPKEDGGSPAAPKAGRQ